MSAMLIGNLPYFGFIRVRPFDLFCRCVTFVWLKLKGCPSTALVLPLIVICILVSNINSIIKLTLPILLVFLRT